MKIHINNIVFGSDGVKVTTSSGDYLINVEDYFEYQFVINQTVEKELLVKLVKHNTVYEIESYLLKLIKSKDASSFTLKKRLSSKYSDYEEDIEILINKYQRKGYINDDRLVFETIEKGLRKFKGIERIKNELLFEGFSYDFIESHIKIADYEEEKSQASILANKVYKQAKTNPKGKVYQKLRYAGYCNEIIDSIMITIK